MCLLVVLSRVIPGAPLVVAANRDEWLDRPSLAMTSLSEAPRIRGGRDQRAGGTWLATSESGLVAGLTNAPMIMPPTVPKEIARRAATAAGATPRRARGCTCAPGVNSLGGVQPVLDAMRRPRCPRLPRPLHARSSARRTARARNPHPGESPAWSVAQDGLRARAPRPGAVRTRRTHPSARVATRVARDPSLGSDRRRRSSAGDGRRMRPRRSLWNTLGADRHRPRSWRAAHPLHDWPFLRESVAGPSG